MINDLAPMHHIAIVGGGPSALFIYKRLIEAGHANLVIHIFEAKSHLGYGMPYSPEGASFEHITNVSDNEIPDLITKIPEWIKKISQSTLDEFNIKRDTFNEFKVLPRLLFGRYLEEQFEALLIKAKQWGLQTYVHLNSKVTDIIDRPDNKKIIIKVNSQSFESDYLILCTGHNWLKKYEDKIPGYFDSPYPPSKLVAQFDHAVAIRGSSLTAIDAIRTLARHNGHFRKEGAHKLSFHAHENTKNFRIIMHSRHGLLPCIRFNLDNPHVTSSLLLSKEDILRHMDSNDGFVSLDYIFEKDFKDVLRKKDPAFYERVKDMSIEEFVEIIIDIRKSEEPFAFFMNEYEEAEKSIHLKKTIHWKEILAILSFAMNYPAKHFSAEDMIRHKNILMPLISIVIAFVPQSSCEELMALHEAGRLDLIAVGSDSRIEPNPSGGITFHYQDDTQQYDTFIDCIGQRHLSLEEFPFRSLIDQEKVVPARLKFRSAQEAMLQKNLGNRDVELSDDGIFYLKVPGIAVTDQFQPVTKDGTPHSRLYIMAVSLYWRI